MFLLEITTLGLLAASVITGLASYFGARSTNKSNQEMQNAANQANVDLWREQTAYNDPSAMMQRYEKAGLNPNLVYGNLSSSNASQAPQMLASRNENPVHIDPLTAAQIANLDADAEEKRSNANKNYWSIKMGDKEFELNKSKTGAEIENYKRNWKLLDKQMRTFDDEHAAALKNLEGMTLDNRIKAVNATLSERTIEMRIDQLAADIGFTKQQTKQIVQQMLYYPRMMDATINELYSRANSEDSSSYLDYQSARKASADADMSEAQFKEWDSEIERAAREWKARKSASHDEADTFDGADNFGLKLLNCLDHIVGAVSPLKLK